MTMEVTLVTPEGRSKLPASVADYEEIIIAVSLTRQICLSYTIERKPDESKYAAFFILGPEADRKYEFEKVFGGMSIAERLVATIFHGKDVEPELPTEVINLDGVSVISIDLSKQLPGHIVFVPEHYVPPLA